MYGLRGLGANLPPNYTIGDWIAANPLMSLGFAAVGFLAVFTPVFDPIFFPKKRGR